MPNTIDQQFVAETSVDQMTGRTALTAGALNKRLTLLRKALPFWKRVAGGVHHGVLSAIAAFIAYVPVELLGFKEAFWGAITAIAVLQTELHATQTTARDQFIGAAIGGFVALCVLLVFGGSLPVYLGTVVLGMSACSALNVASASRLSGSTVTIILLVPHSGPPEQIMVARVTEVAWGVCVAICLVWLAERVPVPGLAMSKDHSAI